MQPRVEEDTSDFVTLDGIASAARTLCAFCACVIDPIAAKHARPFVCIFILPPPSISSYAEVKAIGNTFLKMKKSNRKIYGWIFIREN